MTETTPDAEASAAWCRGPGRHRAQGSGAAATLGEVHEAHPQVVEHLGHHALLVGRQVALRLLLEHREDVDVVLGGFEIHVHATVSGSDIHFDLMKSSPPCKGPMNSVWATTQNHNFFLLGGISFAFLFIGRI